MPTRILLSAVTVPSQFYLGSALVDPKTNEIPVARELFGELDLAGRWVSLDALHTQTETARNLVLAQGAPESRPLEARPGPAETRGFPCAAQAAQLTRQRRGRQAATVRLLTARPPAERAPRQWRQANRHGWGIENGSQQRLEVSLKDDRCRVRSPNGLWLLGLRRRRVISLFAEWRGRPRKPHPKHFTDFQAAMGEDNLAKALGFITQQRSAR